MNYRSILSHLRLAWVVFTLFALAILSACSADYCGDLVFNEALDTCECPEGTEPDYDLDACVGDGIIIPWGGVRISPEDGGQLDGALMDSGADDPRDAGQDIWTDLGEDGRSFDMGVDAGPDAPIPDAGDDAGPPPTNAMARFPWNGFTTGSLHARDSEPLVNHPLRPKFMWEETADADHYQIQLSRECDISEFRTCPFLRTDLDETTSETTFRPGESLAVARTRPMGSRYFWRIRACSATEVCSDWTEVRYLDVGRDSHDYNGDGYADVVVGAYAQSLPESREGAVYVFFGQAAGPTASPSIVLDSPDGQPSTRFGASVRAAGDVNGDGYFDLLVGAHHYDSPEDREGAAFLYFGSATGLAALPDLTFDNPLDQAGGRFGHTCTGAGDLNGDGYADLAIGATSQGFPEDQEGVVYLYFGATPGPNVEPSMVLDSPEDAVNTQFGSFLNSADFDGDGYPDLVAGVQTDTDIYVYVGGQTLSDSPTITLPAPDMRTAFYGVMGEPGDVNADGFADIILGAPWESRPELEEGAIHVFLGSRSGITWSTLTTDHPENLVEAHLGVTVAAVDLNGDGLDELLAGAHGHTAPGRDDGAVFVFSWTDEPTLAVERLVHNPENDPRSFFQELSAGDYNGDGYGDVIVGANNQNDRGAVFVYFGSPTGISATPGVSIPNPEAQRGSFGFSVQ